MTLRIHPFQGWRPAPGTANTVASVPYDVVNRAEARALAEGNPNSFLHVIRPDIDLPDETDPYADVVYDTAKAAFDRFKADGVLVQDDTPAVYLYRQECQLLGHQVSQTGVVACCHTGDYEANVIKKHEKTRQKKEDDRTRHVLTLRANAGPVFLMHKAQPTVRTLVEGHTSAEPLEHFTALDGVTHTLWKVEEYEPYIAAFATLDAAYVADGHHRSASAARAGKELAAANPSHTGDEEYNWFLCVLFDQSDLSILPYNRVVKDLNTMSADEVLAKVAAVAQVTPEVDPTPRHRASFCMYLPGVTTGASPNHWYNIQLAEASIDFDDPIASLDYVLLTDRILTPILGIGDVRSDERIDFVGGIRGTDELKRRVDSGEMAVAFAMRPVEAEQIVAVADAAQIMPPKSTWFEPKLRSGLVVHTLE